MVASRRHNRRANGKELNDMKILGTFSLMNEPANSFYNQ